MNKLLVLAAFAAALALAEAGLRLAGFSYPSFHVPDAVLGTKLRPGMEGWYRAEGEAYVRINSRGLRDGEHPVEKPPSTVRIAVLGDSFTEALQVAEHKTFWAVLERELNACRAFGARRAEVVNFGVSNYGTAQQLLALRHRAWDYDPDVVLLAFFPGNDVRNNSRALERGKTRPFFVLKGDSLVLDASFREDPKVQKALRLAEWLAPLQPLRLYQLARKAKAGEAELRHDAPIAVALAAEAGKPPPLGETGLDEAVLRPPPDEAWEAAWRITERILSQMSREVRDRGSRFVVAVLSSAGTVYPDPGMRAAYARHLGVKDLFYPERRIGALAEREGFESIALAPAMQRHADASGELLHGFENAMPGFGHWNEAGHRVAGRLLAERFCPA